MYAPSGSMRKRHMIGKENILPNLQFGLVRMSCRLKDYYKEGVPLDKSMQIISGLIDKERDIVNKVQKDFSSLNLISRNLESLGFLKYAHPPAAPEVTLRGGTLVLSRRSYLISKLRIESVPIEMGRFVLLKAVRDSDWECFKEFFSAMFIDVPGNLNTEKTIREYIHNRYYRRFSKVNFYHWYRLHVSLIEETGATTVLERKGDSKKGILSLLDPYSEVFSPTEFFAKRLKQPTLGELKAIVEEALSIYNSNLLGPSFIGHCETLKSIIQILLLNVNLFEDELRLSDKVISILRKKRVSLMRSNLPTLTDGRGLIDRSRTQQTSFKLFSLAQATFDDGFEGTPD